ncbi:MAG: hypothetical protein ACYDDO_03320 [Acidiferrobacterales bacterium]
MRKPEIVKANTIARNRLLIFGMAILLVGIVVAVALPPYLAHLVDPVNANPGSVRNAVIVVLAVLAGACAILPVILGLLLLQVGRKVLANKRYPYRGMDLVSDTRVLTGAAALKRARLFLALSVLSFALAPLIGWHLFSTATRIISLIP